MIDYSGSQQNAPNATFSLGAANRVLPNGFRRLNSNSSAFSEDYSQASTSNLTITNQTGADAKCMIISCVPDANFKVHGVVEITVNGVHAVLSKAADFTDVQSINIDFSPYGVRLPNTTQVTIRIRNDDNVTSVNLTVLAVIIQ